MKQVNEAVVFERIGGRCAMNAERGVELLATELLGWHRPGPDELREREGPYYGPDMWFDDTGFRVYRWRPFTSVGQAWRIVSAMVRGGWGYNMDAPPGVADFYVATFYKFDADGNRGGFGQAQDKKAGGAICTAALRALGLE